jgi:hypothetical protein
VASPRWEEPLGLAHKDGRWVTWISTDGVAEIEAEHGGVDLSKLRREAAVGA